ncbi:MAG: nuclear transport factor 2 family protein [Candidatus Binatia bacterium]
MTAEEQQNLQVAKRYEDLYNTDAERFVRECYTSDCKAYAVGAGVIEGHEQFVQVEKGVLRAAPKRKMRVDHTHAVGDAVVVEAVLLNPDKGANWQLPFCAVLVCRDGKIVIDRTYADFSDWPGLANMS